MIRVTILYPNESGKKMDMDYYTNKHIFGLVQERLKPLGLVRAEVDKPMSGPGGAPAPFAAIGHLYFNSVDDFQKGFAQHAQEIMGDIPNYTDIQPQIQISEVVER